jgi:imidazoleglycerol-phosphate dehydratase
MSPSGRNDRPVKPAKHDPVINNADSLAQPDPDLKNAESLALPERAAKISRLTKETAIDLSLSLDGGPVSLDLEGLGFIGHMLNTLATYAGFGLTLSLKGDNFVDQHHGVEDLGLVLGLALEKALGDYTGHARFGSALVPMDESLAEVALDIGRRPYLYFEVNWPQPTSGQFELCLVEEFFRALSQKAGLTIHLIGRHGRNSHHLCEALFKAAGLALGQATKLRVSDGSKGPDQPFSTKGVL